MAGEVLQEPHGGGSAQGWWRLNWRPAVVLLAGAGLLGKSFYRLLHVDAGLNPERLATLRVEGQRESYSKDEQAIALERSVIDRITGLPGIKSGRSHGQVAAGRRRWHDAVSRGRPSLFTGTQ